MSQNAKVFYLKKSQVFAEFSDSQVKELAKLLHDKTLKECELVFAAEDKDKIFFVKKGAVDINKITRDGRKITVDTLNAGSFFGSVGKGLPEDYYVEASEDAYICVADKDKLYAMLEKYPKFALRMVEGLFIQMLDLQEKISIMTIGSVREKIIYLLQRLSRSYGEEDKDGKQMLTRKFTHEQLAEMIGASRETVTKMLSILTKEGVIEKKGRYIVVDCKALSG